MRRQDQEIGRPDRRQPAYPLPQGDDRRADDDHPDHRGRVDRSPEVTPLGPGIEDAQPEGCDHLAQVQPDAIPRLRQPGPRAVVIQVLHDLARPLRPVGHGHHGDRQPQKRQLLGHEASGTPDPPGGIGPEIEPVEQRGIKDEEEEWQAHGPRHEEHRDEGQCVRAGQPEAATCGPAGRMGAEVGKQGEHLEEGTR